MLKKLVERLAQNDEEQDYLKLLIACKKNPFKLFADHLEPPHAIHRCCCRRPAFLSPANAIVFLMPPPLSDKSAAAQMSLALLIQKGAQMIPFYLAGGNICYLVVGHAAMTSMKVAGPLLEKIISSAPLNSKAWQC